VGGCRPCLLFVVVPVPLPPLGPPIGGGPRGGPRVRTMMVTVHVPSWYLVPPLGVPSPAVLTFQGCVWEGGGVEGGAWFPTPPLPLPPPPLFS
jgi:hypothetical protein